MKRFNKAVIILSLLYFIQGVVHNFGHPITPGFIYSLEIDKYMFGVFFALMSLGLTIGGLFSGLLSQRYSKGILILISLFGYSVFQFTFGTLHYVVDGIILITLMSISRLLSGLFVSISITLYMTLIIENTDIKNTRKPSLALFAASFLVGTTIGYFIGGHLPSLFLRYSLLDTSSIVFVIQAISNIVYGILGYILLNTFVELNTHSEFVSIVDGFKNLKNLDSNLLLFFCSLTFITTGMININKYIDVYLTDLGVGSEGIGNFVFVTGIVALISTVLIVPLINTIKKDLSIMIIIQLFSILIILIVFVLIPLYYEQYILLFMYSLFMIYVVLKTLFSPLEQHFISKYTNKTDTSIIMGVRQAFFAIGLSIGPLIGGFIYNYNKELLFVFSIVMFLIGMIIIMVVKRRLNKVF